MVRAGRAVILAAVVAGLAGCSSGASSPVPATGDGAASSSASVSAAVSAAASALASKSARGGVEHDPTPTFVDPAAPAAGADPVPGPSPRPGVVASLPASAIPGVSGYTYGSAASSVTAVASSAGFSSGVVTRTVRRSGVTIGSVTVYRLTAQARNDPNTDLSLVPALLSSHAGIDPPQPTVLRGQQVLQVSGSTEGAIAWHQSERLIVVWGASLPQLTTYASGLIAAL